MTPAHRKFDKVIKARRTRAKKVRMGKTSHVYMPALPKPRIAVSKKKQVVIDTEKEAVKARLP